MIPFPEILLGHLVGDYLLQNQWMALNKSRNDKIGWLSCTIHCTIYTMAVCLTTWNISPLWILIIFLNHFIIDKFRITDMWLKLIGGRTLKNFVDDYISIIDKSSSDELSKNLTIMSITASFASIVYTVADNTLHLLIMYYGFLLII